MMKYGEERTVEYEFFGRHMMIEMIGCNVDLDDEDLVYNDMTRAIELVGATILGVLKRKFEPQGLTQLFLLSESHASIHVYPEHRQSAFLDIFTCGTTIDVRPFARILAERWQPERVQKYYTERGDYGIATAGFVNAPSSDTGYSFEKIAMSLPAL